MNWRKAILIPVLMLVLVLVLENPHVTLAQGGDGDGTEHPQSDPVEVNEGMNSGASGKSDAIGDSDCWAEVNTIHRSATPDQVSVHAHTYLQRASHFRYHYHPAGKNNTILARRYAGYPYQNTALEFKLGSRSRDDKGYCNSSWPL